jgi:hypothetical protein
MFNYFFMYIRIVLLKFYAIYVLKVIFKSLFFVFYMYFVIVISSILVNVSMYKTTLSCVCEECILIRSHEKKRIKFDRILYYSCLQAKE